MPQFLRIGSYYIDQLLIVVKVNFFLHSKYYLYTNSVHNLSTLYIKIYKKRVDVKSTLQILKPLRCVTSTPSQPTTHPA